MKTQVRRLKQFQQLGTAQTRSVVIDQGTDRGGEDVGFRPTELWLIALSSCSATTMTRYADQQGYSLTGITIDADDTVNGEGYIQSVQFKVMMEGDLTAEQKADLLDYVKRNCKLLLTVHPDIQVDYIESDDPISFKKIVYEMRFDEVSARFGEFGSFYVGNLLTDDKWSKMLNIE